MRLLHVMLPVADLPRAIAFYEALGFSVRRQKDYGELANAYVAAAEGPELELACDPARPTHARAGHVAFEVSDLEACCATVMAAGGAIVRAPGASAATSRVFAYVADPDGNVLELLEALRPRA